jgi:hypothetical protein
MAIIRISDPKVKIILPKITPEQNRDLWRWRKYLAALAVKGEKYYASA